MNEDIFEVDKCINCPMADNDAGVCQHPHGDLILIKWKGIDKDCPLKREPITIKLIEAKSRRGENDRP